MSVLAKCLWFDVSYIHAGRYKVMQSCWALVAEERPAFKEVLVQLEGMEELRL